MSPRSRGPHRLGRSVVLALTACTLVTATACKRQRAPEVPEVWDEEAAPERAEALGNLAPPWPAPTKAVLEDGLLTFWLHEPRSPAAHVRLMLPIDATGDVSAETAASVAEMLHFELRRRLARYDADVEVAHRPGRLEIAMHGPDEHLPQMLRWLGWALSRKDPSSSLAQARDRLRGDLDVPSSDEVAAAMLTARLLGLDEPERLDTAELDRLRPDDLEDGWQALTDPRRAVMAVHAGITAEAAKDDLRRLADTWRGRGRMRVPKSAIDRLRARASGDGTSAKASSATVGGALPLWTTDARTRGGPVLILGRTITTPSAKDRSFARLSQRILQEELDVRLTISGEEAVLLVVVPVSGRNADAVADKTLDQLDQMAARREPKQRLFQTAQLWLGARVVQASLDGEDWTHLWSEAIDLSSDDAAIATALARDARIMLDVEPGELVQWQGQWLNPRGGKPGWQWAIAGADEATVRKLARLATIHQVDG